MTITPTNNNALVEIIKEHAGVARAGTGESPNRGLLLKVAISPYHITASSGFDIDTVQMSEYWRSAIDHVVRWEEYADSGQKFTEDGKEYALIPWWRITAVEDRDESKASKEES